MHHQAIKPNPMVHNCLNGRVGEPLRFAPLLDIAAIRIEQDLTRDQLLALSVHVGADRQDRLQSMSNTKLMQRSLYGELLVRALVLHQADLPPDAITFRYGELGKPLLLLDGLPSLLHSNASHSGDYVVAALSSHEVGIDVQYKRSVQERIYRRALSEVEREHILSLAMADRLSYFHQIWTQKESYTKCLGVGLQKSFTSFSASPLLLGAAGEAYHVSSRQLASDYELAICSAGLSLVHDAAVRHVTEQELLAPYGGC